ncbi:hypothetical protein V6R86_02615 [Sphingomonas kaistensis]|uniref:Uncharacterized protein n=1 Tax=Sphingomonas kaistensis TaxID=298708 RepID=A0ABZ2FZH4_9SPHN
MKTLIALALLIAAAPAVAQSQRVAFVCTAEASSAGLTARTERQFDRRGDLRAGATTIRLPLTGADGTLDASWEVTRGLPQVARGKYVFRLPAPADASWQIAGLTKPIRSKDGVLMLGGEQFRSLLFSGASIQLILAGRDGRERARASLDRAAFDAALDLARQSDARGLAQASNFRSCKANTGA